MKPCAFCKRSDVATRLIAGTGTHGCLDQWGCWSRVADQRDIAVARALAAEGREGDVGAKLGRTTIDMEVLRARLDEAELLLTVAPHMGVHWGKWRDRRDAFLASPPSKYGERGAKDSPEGAAETTPRDHSNAPAGVGLAAPSLPRGDSCSSTESARKDEP